MDYLIEENGIQTHYFYRVGEGICVQRSRGEAWQPRECVLRTGKDGFGLYPDGKKVHIVTVNDCDELIYLTGAGSEWRKFILKKLSEDAVILQIRLYTVRGRINMLYTVSLGDDLLLLHCILGNNAKPHIVAKLAEPDFFISGMRVYYVGANNCAGFSELGDEKPEIFIRIAESCGVPYLYGGHIVYISNGKIYFDSHELCTDKAAQRVIITESDARLFVVWKSGDYVRYMPSDCPGRPHCIINPAREAQLYAVWRGGCCEYIYGSHSDRELVTYINPSPFGPRSLGTADNLRRRLEDMKAEINELKHRLSELQ